MDRNKILELVKRTKTFITINTILVFFYGFVMMFYYAVSSPFNDVRSITLLWILFILTFFKPVFPFMVSMVGLVKDYQIIQILSFITLCVGIFTIASSLCISIWLILSLQFSNTKLFVNFIGNDPRICCLFLTDINVPNCYQPTSLTYLIDNNLVNLTDLMPNCTFSDGSSVSSVNDLKISQNLILFIISSCVCLVNEIVMLIIQFEILLNVKQILVEHKRRERFPTNTSNFESSTSKIGTSIDSRLNITHESKIGQVLTSATNKLAVISEKIGNIFSEIGKDYVKEKTQ